MTVTYIVKFQLYHYNSGNARNGFYMHEESFKELKEAQAFADIVKFHAIDRKNVEDSDEKEKELRAANEFARRYCWDGYVQSYNGIYKVTEEKL
jgi:hypothetical protein